MNIIKRSGAQAVYDGEKIKNALSKANQSVPEQERLSAEAIEEIEAHVHKTASAMSRALGVEEIQDIVEREIMNHGAFNVARNYIKYRYIRSLARKANTTDDRILSLIDCNNEEVMQENSNKNPTVNSVQRDYMAGEISKDLTARLLLDLFVLALDQAQNTLVSGVGLTLQALDVAVGDIVPCYIMGLNVHQLVLHQILHLFHADGAVKLLALVGNGCGDLGDLLPGQAILTAHRITGFGNGGDDLGNIKRNFCTVSFDDLHRFSSFYIGAL